MEEIKKLRTKAKEKIMLADHILIQTYPLVNDPRLLLSVLENIYLSMNYALKSLLHYEFVHKNVPLYPKSFDIRIKLFELKVLNKYHINKKYIRIIKEIKELLLHHQESPIEFVRNDSFVICDEHYQLKIVTIQNVKQYLREASEFVSICVRCREKADDRKIPRSTTRV